MADVSITPKIRCDNCGYVEDKTASGSHSSKEFSKPRAWGSARMEGSRSADSYGGKSRLDAPDLCPACADAALNAAADALEAIRDPARSKAKEG